MFWPDHMFDTDLIFYKCIVKGRSYIRIFNSNLVGLTLLSWYAHVVLVLCVVWRFCWILQSGVRVTKCVHVTYQAKMVGEGCVQLVHTQEEGGSTGGAAFEEVEVLFVVNSCGVHARKTLPHRDDDSFQQCGYVQFMVEVAHLQWWFSSSDGTYIIGVRGPQHVKLCPK